MKRLNPETGKPFARGDTRADGFLFLQYDINKGTKKNGFYYESWLNPNKMASNNQTRLRVSREWWHRNKEKRKTATASWRLKNKEHEKQTAKLWRENNRDVRCAIQAKRRAAQLQRMPWWLTQEHLHQIESVYALAKQLTEETGIQHHVDHIVPLQGKTVCGLHVPWNLRAIPATENCSKRNSHES